MAATVRGISVDSGDRGSSINIDGVTEYTIVYKVSTDDKRDGARAARIAPGVPSIGDTYTPGNDLDAHAVVVGKDVRQGDAPTEWLVDVTYSTDVGGKDPKAINYDSYNPLNDPPDISFGFQERRILVPGSYNNPIGPPTDKGWEAGIFAPNGDLFDPQPEVGIADPVWHIKRNLQSISYSQFTALANAVNSDTFEGIEPRQLQLKPPTAQRKWHKACNYYWEVSYQIAYRWETWDIQILNQGYYYWPSGKPASVWSTTTLPSVKKLATGELRMVNLTTDGNVNNGSAPTFTRIRFFREIPFSPLGLLT